MHFILPQIAFSRKINFHRIPSARDYVQIAFPDCNDILIRNGVVKSAREKHPWKLIISTFIPNWIGKHTVFPLPTELIAFITAADKEIYADYTHMSRSAIHIKVLNQFGHGKVEENQFK